MSANIKTDTRASEMPFIEHLRELRTRLAIAGLGILIASGFCFFWSQRIFTFLVAPLRETFVDGQMIGTSPAEAFIVKLKISIVGGVVASIPITFYQLWRFIAPGLHQHEKRFALPFVAACTACFLTGAGFCFYVVLPAALSFFSGEFASIALTPAIRVGDYMSLVLRLILVFGIAFELPVLSYFLSRLGLLTHRWLIERFRYALVAVFIAAGVLTPGPDIVSQLLLAAPLLVLYGLCIVVARFSVPPKAAAVRGDGSAAALESRSNGN